MLDVIKFKKASDIDFTSIFPIISQDYYSLIEDTIIELNDVQKKELLSENLIRIGDVELSSKLFDKKEPEVLTTSKWIDHTVEIKQEMDKKYMFMDPLVDALCQGIELEENVMLYGRGGHNKSEGTLAILKMLNQRNLISDSIYVKSFGDGTTTEELFGGVQLDLYMKESKIEYNVLNSFMNYEYVIFEEFYDAPSSVLLVLKDILTSGYFRNGDQMFKIKCKCIIALTNRSKDEVATDRSIEALTQRFSITQLVEWDLKDYNKINFVRLLNKVLGKDLVSKFKVKTDILVSIAEETNNGNSTDRFISPRSLIKAAKSYYNGAELTVNIDFDPQIIDRTIKALSSNSVQTDEELMYCQNLLIKFNTFIKDKGLNKLEDPLLALTTTDLVTINNSKNIRMKQAKTIIHILTNTTFDAKFIARRDGILQILNDTIKQ